MLKRMFLNISVVCLIAHMLSMNVYGSNVLLSSEGVSDTLEVTAYGQFYGDYVSPSGMGIVGIEGNSIAIQPYSLYASNVTLGDSGIGDLVKINVNGQPYDFIVVHKGKPSSIYDNSFDDGVILLMKDIYAKTPWFNSSNNSNEYLHSYIHQYLNTSFFNLINEEIRFYIRPVIIPYTRQTEVKNGINGLYTYIWVLSAYEVNFITGTNGYLPVDGAVFSYFSDTSLIDDKRIAYLSGTSTNWWIRTPMFGDSVYSYGVNDGGSLSYYGTSYHASLGVRPAFVLPSSLLVSSDGFVMPEQSSDVGSTLPVSGLPEDLTDFLTGLIIPGDDFWNRQYTVFSDKFQDKLPYGTYIDVIRSLSAIADTSSGFDDIDFDFNGRSLSIPLSIVNPFLELPRLIIRGLFTILLAYYNYRQILFLIRGSTYSSMGDGGNS